MMNIVLHFYVFFITIKLFKKITVGSNLNSLLYNNKIIKIGFFPVSSNVGFEEGDLGWMAQGAGLVRFQRQLFISKFSKKRDCFKTW